MKKKLNTLKSAIKIVLGISAIFFVVSCEEAFEFDLPEAGSIPDLVLPQANFSTTPDAENFRKIKFTNTSSEATNYIWDFGGGDTSTDKDPIYIFEAGEGDYEVTLTALDANNASGITTQMVEVRDVFVPINPIVINGDMETGFTPSWKIDKFTGGTTTTVNTSSDGSPINYDEVDTGSKTKGMKFAAGTSDPGNPGSRRYAYQALTVSPTTADRTVKYIIEYAYAIKVAASPGSNITVQILDGHFEDGADALASTPLAESVANELNGKGNFTIVKKEFTSNASGLISIWIFGDTDQDAYIDNVKVYPKP
ncbi:PKD domain-containing protein [Aureibaculum conchae]|uniref:PKD domain-containing protein n=1 Tax=Aureibaculum sp. 2308TA14-22 TaxID=3108392 RepID=UPI0033962ED2